MPGFTDLDFNAARLALSQVQLSLPSSRTVFSIQSTIQQLDNSKIKQHSESEGIHYQLLKTGELSVTKNNFSQENLLAEGDLFFNLNGQLRGISNYFSFFHIFLVLYLLKQHQIPFMTCTELLQADPPASYWLDTKEMQRFLNVIPTKLVKDIKQVNQYLTTHQEDDEDYALEEEIFYLASPTSVIGFFGDRKRLNNTPVEEAVFAESASYSP